MPVCRWRSVPLPVLVVDHALMGVLLPAGEGDLVLDYHSRYFVPSAWLTLVSLLGCIGLVIFSYREKLS